jgi:hypothetical protein
MSEKARKKPERRWRDPSTIGSQNAELEITKAAESIGWQSRWTRPDATTFVRRALEVAVKEAIKYQGRRSRDQFDYWQEASQLSAQASAAIKLLIRHIEPDGLKNGIEMRGYGSLRASHSLRKLPNGNVEFRKLHQRCDQQRDSDRCQRRLINPESHFKSSCIQAGDNPWNDDGHRDECVAAGGGCERIR